MQGRLVGSLTAVWDQQNRPPRHPGVGATASMASLAAQSCTAGRVQDRLGDDELLPLGLDLLQLLGLLRSERIQFSPPSRDPLPPS